MSIYNSIPAPKLSRNNFNFTHRNNFSFNFHKLYPVLLREVLPGDKHRQGTEQFIRFAPMTAPVLSEIKFSQQAFFVPMRTLSNKWEDFITGGRQGTFAEVLPFTTLSSLSSYIRRVISSQSPPSYTVLERRTVVDTMEFLDFMGIPFDSIEPRVGMFEDANAWDAYRLDLYNSLADFVDSTTPVNLAPFYAFQKVYDEYYRDQNLEDSVLDLIEVHFAGAGYDSFKDHVGMIDLEDFGNFDSSYCLFYSLFSGRKRAWRKDRFTAALPFTQRGPEVLIPIAGTAPAQVDTSTWSGVSDPGQNYPIEAVGSNIGSPSSRLQAGNGADVVLSGTVNFDDADLTTTINEFRRAERLQRWYENSARGGARLNENTLSHWGVRTPDATLDRAEFLGGTSSPVVISEIPQTSESGDTPLGTLGGKATGYNSGYLYSRYFSEHGIVIVIASCMVAPTYQQGIDRIYTRQSRFDYAWPEFANLGEEPVYTRELWAKADPDKVFGYLPRYYDYKSAVSETHGQFKSSLFFWHMSRIFDNEPKLNKDFIMSDPRYNSFAVTDPGIEHIYCTMIFHERISRLLPYYGVPTI